MNPFKYKQQEEFTIADCESYLSKYQYGEYVNDVEKRLRLLRGKRDDDDIDDDEDEDDDIDDDIDDDEDEDDDIDDEINENDEGYIPPLPPNRGKVVFAWIVAIVAACIVSAFLAFLILEIFGFARTGGLIRVGIVAPAFMAGKWVYEQIMDL